MDSVIRKISIGSDYKNDAMHYSVGQQVYGGHEIAYILFDDQDSSYNIHIKKNNEVLPWKKFNSHMAVSVEYDLGILMKSVYDFIIKPVGKVYDNSIDVDGKELLLNTSIEKHKFVNNKAIVVSTPLLLLIRL